MSNPIDLTKKVKELAEKLAKADADLKWEMAASAVDIAGMVDPTPASDAIGAAMALRKGDYAGAGMNALSMVPYLGDALAKPAKALRSVKRINDLRQAMTKFAAELADAKKALKEAENAATTAKQAKVATDTAKTAKATPSKNAAVSQQSTAKNNGNKDCKDCDAKKSLPREFKVLTTHRAGNRQVLSNGQRWNVPKKAKTSQIPVSDSIGDSLQGLAKEASERWNPRRNLSLAEREAIAKARSTNEHWRANLLEQQAKGRWIENQVKAGAEKAGINLDWNRKGVDVVDAATGLRYDIMSGTKSNMDTHAKRMPNELFRMIVF